MFFNFIVWIEYLISFYLILLNYSIIFSKMLTKGDDEIRNFFPFLIMKQNDNYDLYTKIKIQYYLQKL